MGLFLIGGHWPKILPQNSKYYRYPELNPYRLYAEYRSQIGNQCCGSGMFIPDPDFYPSQIPDLGFRIQNSNKREG
jgi:hypothetical protein